MHKLTAISLAGALVLSPGTALAQTDGARLNETVQDRAAMREMIREMMEEMMREAPQRGLSEPRFERAPDTTDRARGERVETRDEDRRDWRGRHHGMMGRYGMMRHHRGGMRSEAFHGARMKIAFAIFDANGDGAVTINEMNELHKRIFNAIDQNGDGGLTQDEIRNFFHGDSSGEVEGE